MTTNTTPAQAGQQDYPESPMRKVAQALREKAAAEREAFDQRIQSGEWGPMPEPETEADSWVLPGSISDVWTTFRGERCLTPAGDDYYTAAQVRAAYEAGRASVAGSTAATGAGAVPDVDVERIAVNRYRPVPAGVITYKVVAGDGTRSLFSGTKDECEIVARKLTEAFLDGAHVALAASQGAPANPVDAAVQKAWARFEKEYARIVADDLSTLVTRLAHALHNAAPGNDMPAKALDYLRRQGLEPSPLREVAIRANPPEPVVGSHSPGCWANGPKHYECALAEIERLKVQSGGKADA